jgi:DNA polymerase I-like protein with 3'-5' exonuclease and polymerase domains
MNEFCVTLADMEKNGIAIDLKALADLKEEYEAEKLRLEQELQDIVTEVMGDTPVNLASSDQKSQLIYSRRVIDKAAWAETFNIGVDARGKPLRRPRMTQQELRGHVNRLTERIRKTKAVQCGHCRGTGKETKHTKSGELYKKLPACKHCNGTGIIYNQLPPHAGLRQSPVTINDITANGFATDKDTLNILAERVQHDKSAPAAAKRFLNGIVRLNAVKTYLSSFVGGIERNTRATGLLHCSFNQCITKTGRLSSSDPNFQNQPRGGTFPIRRAIVSRFEGGSILEGDEAQLEFRVAGELSGDPQVKIDIENKADVHSFTAQTLTDAGQTTNRQGAKCHTFKPLYGGTSGTEAEQAYYKAFAEKYKGVTEWHERLLTEACTYKYITTPSGRQYAFPSARRQPWGGVTGATQIKNFPVQGFATADIVPCVVIMIWKEMKAAGLKSILINTVHDSVVADCYPGEEMQVAKIMYRCLVGVKHDIKRRYNYEMKLDLEAELKIGPNWLDTKVVPLQELQTT